MTRGEALDELRSWGGDLAMAVAAATADELRERMEDPGRWARFHEAMAVLLPRWRWLARLHHRRLARRYRAMLKAQQSR